MELRKEILEYSLMLESFTSLFLAMVLDVKNIQDSKTLGNKSSALSFMQKIDIFLDAGAIDKKERTKFETFMSIRNQFMHNLHADSFTACMKYIDGCENYLLKQYLSTVSQKEEQLGEAVRALVDDVFTASMKIFDKGRESIKLRIESKFYKDVTKAMIEFIGRTKNR